MQLQQQGASNAPNKDRLDRLLLPLGSVGDELYCRGTQSRILIAGSGAILDCLHTGTEHRLQDACCQACGDGQTELFNRATQAMMQDFVGSAQSDWDDHLRAIEFAFINAYHGSIMTTPVRFRYGQDPPTPAIWRIPKFDSPVAIRLTTAREQRMEEAKIC